MRMLYDYVAGVGGIGSGILFRLAGNHTLGRNESRQAQLTDSRDYCKLHIILHYVSTFLEGQLPVYAIGRVGKDENGRQLKQSMHCAGIDVNCVSVDAHNPTMYAVCYQYPSGECCNISTQNSACRTVGKEDVDRFFETVPVKSAGVILAVPEVPLQTRIYLLEMGRKRGCFNIASVLSGEVKEFMESGGAEKTDLLAINEEEAERFVQSERGSAVGTEDTAEACMEILKHYNPDICTIITLGEKGAYAGFREKRYRSPAIRVPVVSTAGAGDCLIGTVTAAIVKGISLFPRGEGKNKMAGALDLGVLASAKKVGCKDTIDFSMNADSLLAFAAEYGISFPADMLPFFEGKDSLEDGGSSVAWKKGKATWKI